MKWTVTPLTKSPHKKWPGPRQWGNFLVWCVVLGLIFVASLFIYIQQTLPDPSSIALRKVSESTKIYDRTGEILLYDIHGEEKRTIIPWEQIPQSVRDATLAAEDSSYYSHGGFDLRGIIRSILVDLKTFSFSQGGSTITQQLVGNALTGRQKTVLRKISELVLSIQVERQYSKDEILWMYLNQIPYGSNTYGVEEASKTFFGKHASELTINESALLASLIQAPSYYSPYGNHVDALIARKNSVLSKMKELKTISESDYNSATSEKLTFKSSTESILAPHFVIMVKEYLEKKYGKEVIDSGGLKITTTLDVDLQQIAEDAVKKYAPINEKQYKATNAALVSIDPKNGDVLALMGSRDYFDIEKQGNFNVTIDGPGRQPGSSFKPFAYTAAFQKGYPDSTILFDVPTEFNPNCSPGLECYSPRNYDGQFRGPVSLRQALDQSLNIPSVKVLYLAGVSDTISLAKQMGISTLNNPQNYGLSLVLGGAEVHPIDLVSAYGVFANDGVRNPWRIIKKIEDASGNIVEEAPDDPQRVLEPQIARLVDDVLSDNNARAPVFGYNNSLYIPGYDVAAKTGTTQENRDGWVVGFSPDIATVVWTGNNDNSSMTAAGAGISAAGPMWHEFMAKALSKMPNSTFPQPAPVSSSKIMLNGEYLDPSSGFNDIHTILYYIDRNNPLGPPPADPNNDPSYKNWEFGVRRYFRLI
jgi:1A family penicillin-binding protein